MTRKIKITIEDILQLSKNTTAHNKIHLILHEGRCTILGSNKKLRFSWLDGETDVLDKIEEMWNLSEDVKDVIHGIIKKWMD